MIHYIHVTENYNHGKFTSLKSENDMRLKFQKYIGMSGLEPGSGLDVNYPDSCQLQPITLLELMVVVFCNSMG